MQKTKLNQKGIQLNQLVSVVLTIVIITILITIGLRITSGVRDGMTDNSTEHNASDDMAGALTEIASWGTLIGLSIAASVILTIILGAFAFRAGR